MLEPLSALIASAPDAARPFPDTEYGLPIHQALYGTAPTVDWLVDRIGRADGPVAALEPMLALAEAVESVAPDRLEYFIPDGKARGLVFSGAKWRAGWALLVGAGVTEALVRRVVEREFLAFCDGTRAGAVRTHRIPPRPTGMVFFLQLAVRYAMLYGRIAPGDDHELGHFLEADVPGVIVARGPLSPLESVMILGLMKMGVPAVVPSDYPYSQGRQVVADDLEDALRAMGGFPNLRVKEVDGRTVRLPDYADPANAAEEVQPARRIGGPNSFLFAFQDPAAEDGDTVVGEAPADGGEVGIVVRVANAAADDAICGLLEEEAGAALRLLNGVRTAKREAFGEPFAVDLAADAEASPARWAEVIRRKLQFQHPRLGPVSVRVSFDDHELENLAPGVERSRAARQARVSAAMLAEPEVVYACTDCQPFSREHVCIAAPNHPPMCGRDWRDIKAGALFGVGYFPYKRRQDQLRPNERPVPVGRCLDRARGEYEGVNQVVAELSHGAVQRVYLHSVREYPHTSCGCFHYLAFWIDEAGGLGVMHRGFTGRAPNGATWDSLANRAGGKQSPGVTGIGPAYLPLPSFLRGDGGHGNVVWMTRKARDAAGLAESSIATEDDATTIEALVEHRATHRTI